MPGMIWFVFILHDPRESALPNAGLLTVEDAESGELVELDSNRGAVRDNLSKINAERLANWMVPSTSGSGHIAFQHSEEFAGVLQRFFETRRARRRR